MFKGQDKKMTKELNKQLITYSNMKTGQELLDWEMNLVKEVKDYHILKVTFLTLIIECKLKQKYFELKELYEVCEDFNNLIEYFKQHWLHLANKYYIINKDLTIEIINDTILKHQTNLYKDEFGL